MIVSLLIFFLIFQTETTEKDSSTSESSLESSSGYGSQTQNLDLENSIYNEGEVYFTSSFFFMISVLFVLSSYLVRLLELIVRQIRVL